MARYGSKKYGAFHYGSQETSNLLWSIEVDWDGDGVFDGTNEARWCSGLSISRGRRYYLKPDGSGFERVREGTCSLTLDNVKGRYDPYNTRSPLYPNIQPGRFARVRVKQDGIIYPVFAGRVADIKPAAGKEKRVRVELADGMRWLQDMSAAVSIQQNIPISAALQMVLDAASWPAQWGSRIDSAPDQLAWWWEDGKSAAASCHDLAESALGTFFIAADGAASYHSRHHHAAPAASVSQAELGKEIALLQPWEVVRNIVELEVRARVECAEAQLWQLDGALYLAAGQSAKIWARYRYENRDVPAAHVQQPAPAADYEANTLQDGTGADLTANFSILADAFSTSAKLTISNTGSAGGFVTRLALRGDPVDAPNALSVVAEDAASQKSFGKRKFSLANAWLQNTNDAISFADFLVKMLARPRAFPSVSIEARCALQFGVDLFAKVELQVNSLAISSEYQVAEIEHEWLSENGQSVRTSWRLEPAPSVEGYWQFPPALGESSVFAY